MLGAIVAIDDLLMSIAASVVAAMAVTVVISVAIWGMTKYVDFHDEGRRVAAVASLGVGILGVVLAGVVIVVGIALMVAH